MRRARRGEARAFVAEASVTTTDECIPWPFATTRLYGRVNIAGSSTPAHRAVWEAAHGPIRAGLCVLHLCDNPPCVNPAHLLLGTVADNVADMVTKGRNARRESHWHARLTGDIVLAIRADARPSNLIAIDHGITSRHVRKIKAGTAWQAPDYCS